MVKNWSARSKKKAASVCAKVKGKPCQNYRISTVVSSVIENAKVSVLTKVLASGRAQEKISREKERGKRYKVSITSKKCRNKERVQSRFNNQQWGNYLFLWRDNRLIPIPSLCCTSMTENDLARKCGVIILRAPQTSQSISFTMIKLRPSRR